MNEVRDSKDMSPEERPADTRGFFPLFVAAQIFAILSIILVIVWCNQFLGGFDWSDKGQRFNWHPVLMVVGFVFLYGNGVLIYRLMRDEPKPRLKLIHASINGLAFVLAVIALIAVFSFHNEANIPNMYSLHSWIGLGTVILFGLNLTGGLMLFLLPGASEGLKAVTLPLHVFGGHTSLFLILVSIVSGITEKALFKLQPGGYSKLPAEAYTLNFLGISVLIFTLIVAYTVTRPEYKRRPLASEVPLRLAMQEQRR